MICAPQFARPCRSASSAGVKAAKGKAQISVDPAPAPTPVPTDNGGTLLSPTMMNALVVVQAIALAGATTTGILARKRRVELEKVTTKLREMNVELRTRMEQELVPEADDKEALVAYRNALENAVSSPSAAHPVESIGEEGHSVAQARREISKCIKSAKECLKKGNGQGAVDKLVKAEGLVLELKDPIAERTIVRAQARAYQTLGNLNQAVACLERGLALSAKMGDSQADADTLGQLGDLYVDLGQLDKAAEYYDKCLTAIKEGRTVVNESWDS